MRPQITDGVTHLELRETVVIENTTCAAVRQHAQEWNKKGKSRLTRRRINVRVRVLGLAVLLEDGWRNLIRLEIRSITGRAARSCRAAADLLDELNDRICEQFRSGVAECLKSHETWVGIPEYAVPVSSSNRSARDTPYKPA